MIIPGVQKPHCRPCISWNAFCIGCRVPLGVPDALDRGDLAAVGLDGQHGAALHRLAVQVHGAGPAVAGVAADDGADLAELLPQVVDEQRPWFDLVGVGHPVDPQLIWVTDLRSAGVVPVTVPGSPAILTRRPARLGQTYLRDRMSRSPPVRRRSPLDAAGCGPIGRPGAPLLRSGATLQRGCSVSARRRTGCPHGPGAAAAGRRAQLAAAQDRRPAEDDQTGRRQRRADRTGGGVAEPGRDHDAAQPGAERVGRR